MGVHLWGCNACCGYTGRGSFVPLSFAPGEAFQFDWGEDWAVIAGERTKLQVAHFKLSHTGLLGGVEALERLAGTTQFCNVTVVTFVSSADYEALQPNRTRAIVVLSLECIAEQLREAIHSHVVRQIQRRLEEPHAG